MQSLDFSKVSIAEKYSFLPEDFKDCFWSDAELKLKEFMRMFLESCLELEVEDLIKAGWHERSQDRIAYRNGYRLRKSFNAHGFGEITNFRMPRIRGILYESKILVKYQRRSTKFDYDLMTIYISQNSTRGLKRIIKQLFGSNVSHATISKLLKGAQEKLNEWRILPLTKEYEALVLDGLYINIRTIPKIFKKTFYYSKKRRRDTQGVILAVMGITENGTKDIIGFKIAYSESESEWSGLISDLLNRGLKLKQDGVIIHDGAPGLTSAIDLAFPYHKKQLCFFHFIQSASSYAKNISQKKQIQKELSRIYKLSFNYKKANNLFNNFISRWQSKNIHVANYVKRKFASVLTFLTFPEDKRHS